MFEGYSERKCKIYGYLYFDKGLTWMKRIITKRNQLNIKLEQLYWLVGNQSIVSDENRFDNITVRYKAVVKKKKKTLVIQRIHNKVSRVIIYTPWFTINIAIREDRSVFISF